MRPGIGVHQEEPRTYWTSVGSDNGFKDLIPITNGSQTTVFFFWPFMALLIEQLKIWQEMERESWSDMQQGDPGQESNLGPLQSLGTWDARSTHWANASPDHHWPTTNPVMLNNVAGSIVFSLSAPLFHIHHRCSGWACSHLWKVQGPSGGLANSGVL